MNNQNYKEIFNNLKKNSIGNNKRSNNIKYLRKVILKASMTSILVTFLSACSIGIKENNYNNDKVVEESNLHGYDKGFIKEAEKADAINLLKHNGLTDFNIINHKRKYNYTRDDYSKIYRLTDEYFYGLYLLTTEDTFNTILNSRGYNDMNDFLTKNGYLNEQSKPDIGMWERDSLEQSAARLNSYLEEERGYQR